MPISVKEVLNEMVFFYFISIKYNWREISWPFLYRGRSQTTFTRFGFFWPPTPLRLHFLWNKSLQKLNFFDQLPLSSCKRSLWMTPYPIDHSHLRNYRPKPIATFAASVFGIKSVQCWRMLMPCNNVSYVMEFLAWWVLKSKVFAQKSTLFKWNCCIL